MFLLSEKFQNIGNFRSNIINDVKQILSRGVIKKTLAPFYGWGSTVSRLHGHYEEIVYFLPLSPEEFVVLI